MNGCKWLDHISIFFRQKLNKCHQIGKVIDINQLFKTKTNNWKV